MLNILCCMLTMVPLGLKGVGGHFSTHYSIVSYESSMVPKVCQHYSEMIIINYITCQCILYCC